MAENGPDVPAGIKPENYYIDFITSQPHPDAKKDTTYYTYDADFNLLEIRTGEKYDIRYTYSDGLVSDFNMYKLPYSFIYGHKDGKLAYRDGSRMIVPFERQIPYSIILREESAAWWI